jgi:hypothetical protein
MSSTNTHKKFKELFGEYAEVTNNEARLLGTFLGSEKEKSMLSSEDASMISNMLCSLPKSYSLTIVARTGSGTLKPSYMAYGIATVRVIAKDADHLEELFENAITYLVSEEETTDDKYKNN